MHDLLHAGSDAILGVDPPAATVLGDNLEAHVYGTPPGLPGNEDGALPCFAFMSNYGVTNGANVTWNGRDYHLPAWSVSLLPDCANVAYNTAIIGSQYGITTVSPRTPSAAMASSAAAPSFEWAAEPLGIVPSAPAFTMTGPAEQLDATNFTTDYMWYRVAVPVSVRSNAAVPLVMAAANDIVYVWADNQFAGTVQSGNPGRCGQPLYRHLPLARCPPTV